MLRLSKLVTAEGCRDEAQLLAKRFPLTASSVNVGKLADTARDVLIQIGVK